MRKVGRAFFVLSVAAGMTVALQGSASAASYTYRATDVSGGPDWNQLKACSYVNYNGEAGRACFQPNGDKFWVQDLKADGHHVEMNAQVNVNGNWYHCLNYHGKAAKLDVLLLRHGRPGEREDRLQRLRLGGGQAAALGPADRRRHVNSPLSELPVAAGRSAPGSPVAPDRDSCPRHPV